MLKEDFSWEEDGEELQAECGNKLLMRYMGDNVVLIQNFSDFSMEALASEMDEWLRYWFVWHKPWEVSDVYHKRRIWTRWIGVLLHSWCERFFKKVSSTFGTFINLDGVTERKERFDYARVFMSISFTVTINQEISVLIDGRQFKIKIVEENPDPIPSVMVSQINNQGDMDSWSSDSGNSLLSGPAKATLHDQCYASEESSEEEETSVQMGDRNVFTEKAGHNESSGTITRALRKSKSHGDILVACMGAGGATLSDESADILGSKGTDEVSRSGSTNKIGPTSGTKQNNIGPKRGEAHVISEGENGPMEKEQLQAINEIVGENPAMRK